MKHSTSSSLVTRFSDYCLLKGVSTISSYATGRCLDSGLFGLYSRDYDRYCTLMEFYVISNYLLTNSHNKIVAFIDKFLSCEGYDFTLSEFLRSDIAYCNGISNKLHGLHRLYIINFLSLLPLLQTMRSYYKRPMHITSGYRNSKLNKLCGGRPHSRHLCFKAADFSLPSANSKGLNEVYLFAKSLPFRYVHNYGSYIHVDIE